MTSYAVDLERRVLLATWATGAGDIAVAVAPLPGTTSDADAFAVAHALSRLSKRLWYAYTHPASAEDSLEPNSEGWRREGDRAAFTDVLAALRQPNLPTDGMLIQSYIPIEEAAHRVGRTLHAVGDDAFTDAVVTDVTAEIDAVERAELGDLSGRARQAVLLDRADASPVQVMAADAVLREDPFGDMRLFTEFDPTAAAVAAAHWLGAAADVVEEQCGIAATDVVHEADNIEALPVETPTLVLRMLSDGDRPHDIVVSLVREAMAASEGRLPNPNALFIAISDAITRAEQFGDRADEALEALLPSRVTPLDPQRPARDMLEDLLAGIRGCWLLWQDSDHDEDESDAKDESKSDDEYWDTVRDKMMASFLEAVRETAALDADRIG